MRVGRYAAVATLLAVLPAAPAGAAGLQAGVGRADITPPTGYFMMGWVRSDAVGRGQHTRLFARAIVLREGAAKVALVAEDLNGIPGGVLEAAATRLKAHGFSAANIVDTASHTHAAPSQFYNFPSYDTVFMTAGTPTQQNVAGAIDPQLYAFEVRQLAAAIVKADDDLGPARLGWGNVQLPDLTQNRSLEAHLANFGISEPYGTGTVSQDPGGQADTIDPNVDVLRVDKLITAEAPSSPAPARPTCRRTRSHGPRRKLRCHNRRGAHRFHGGRTAGSAAHRRRARRHRRPAATRPTPAPRTRSRWVPVGMFTTFADHGTVNKATFTYYNADHHGSAMRVTEDAMRRQGDVPQSQDVVTAYGNGDEGDVTAGIAHNGPADAEFVGRVEADAMMRAWRQAGQSMTSSPVLDERWTRMCFCGQATDGGSVDAKAVFGLPQLTGSEEGRGPLYDLDHVNFEDRRSATNDPVQGDKIQEAQPPALNVPRAVPLAVLRLGDRLVVTVPGEMTVTMGQRVRSAVMAAAGGAGISRVVIAGLANEYLSYFTTPEEYQRQHYEGGSTLYGEWSSNLLKASLADLAHRLVAGQGAPDAYPYDPTDGQSDTAAPFDPGAGTGAIVAQPQATARFGHAVVQWRGGPRGLDRPVGSPFVTVRRRVGSSWEPVTDDLGLQVLWSVDDQGNYRAGWEVPRDAMPGTYEMVVTANRYRLESAPFAVDAYASLTVRREGSSGAVIDVGYPTAVAEQDITYRPTTAEGVTITAHVDGRPVTASAADGVVHVPAAPGQLVVIGSGAAHDRYANTSAGGLQFTA